MSIESLAKNYQLVECSKCHRLQPLTPDNKAELNMWKFNLTTMLNRKRKSVLGVAIGVCPYCQDTGKLFEDLERKLGLK